MRKLPTKPQSKPTTHAPRTLSDRELQQIIGGDGDQVVSNVLKTRHDTIKNG